MGKIGDKYLWMSDGQKECFQMLADIFGGEHHIYGPVKPFGSGIEHNTFQDFATYDFDLLTRAVVMAHDRIIRFAIAPSGPGRIRLCLWKRESRTGGISDRHPTIEEAIIRCRGEA